MILHLFHREIKKKKSKEITRVSRFQICDKIMSRGNMSVIEITFAHDKNYCKGCKAKMIKYTFYI